MTTYTADELSATFDRLNERVVEGIMKGTIVEVFADITPQLPAIFTMERTATGRVAKIFSVRRYIWRFINRWAKSKKDREFFEEQKKDVLKWQKKQSKVLNMTAKVAGSATNSTGPTLTGNDTIPIQKSIEVETPPAKRPSSPALALPPPIPKSLPLPVTVTKPSYQPIAGQSPLRKDTVHIRHPLPHDISTRDSDEEESREDNRLLESDADYEELPKKRSKLNHHTDIKIAADVKPTSSSTRNPNYRRPPQPTVLYDKPCNRCIQRRKNCEKDAFSTSCVLCYKLKNRCDYGKRHRHGAKSKSKEKGEEKEGANEDRDELGAAKEDMDELESEDEMTGQKAPTTAPTTRQRRSTANKIAYAFDTFEPIPSGYEISQPPSISYTPSPAPRPSRVAALKAKKAVAATVADDMASHQGLDSGDSQRQWKEVARLGSDGIDKAIAAFDRVRKHKFQGQRLASEERRQEEDDKRPRKRSKRDFQQIAINRIETLEEQVQQLSQSFLDLMDVHELSRKKHLEEILRLEYILKEQNNSYQGVMEGVPAETVTEDRQTAEGGTIAAEGQSEPNNLEALFNRLSTLEQKYSKMMESVRSLQEVAGVPEGYCYRLPYRWEGRPPNSFRLGDIEIDDTFPIVVTSTGPAGQIAWLPSGEADNTYVRRD